MFINDNSNAKIVWTFEDKSYLYSKVVCEYILSNNFLTFIESGRGVKKRIFKLNNFRSKTALRAEVALINKLKIEFPLTEELSRPLHDCLYQVYYDLGLDLGYVDNPLRELK